MERYAPDTPLRLETAAELAFPDGTMTVHGLRKERDAGRLVVERIAGRDYTTLANIQEMRRLCRFVPKGQGSSSGRPVELDAPTGPSSILSTADMRRAQDAASSILRGLSGSSKNTSDESTSSRRPRTLATQE